MASGKPELRWPAKIRAAAASCLAGAVAGTVLYFANLGYISAAPPPSSGPPLALCTTSYVSDALALCVSQPIGDGNSGFVIHGTGFPPFTPVTIRLDGVGTSLYHPVADLQGTFNYTIDQGHLFFPGQIPAGDYTVVATAANGHSASVTFTANPPGPPPP